MNLASAWPQFERNYLATKSKKITMSISIWIVLLEVYFNWPLESIKSDKKCASYGIFMSTSRFTDVTEE